MKASYYNVITDEPDGEGYLLYNTLNKGLCTLTREEKRIYDRIATGDGDFYELSKPLKEGGFVLDDPETEAAFLEYQYDRYKYNTEVFELVIATTMDCNNSCIYCCTPSRPGYMSKEVQDKVLEFTQEKYEESPFKKMRVTWIGGEPLLRMDVIERLSKMFINFCDEHGVVYIAHATSNACLATKEVAGKLAECRVRSVMSSLDGHPERHNCRRCSRSGVETYDTIIENMGNLVDAGITTVVNFPLDRKNFKDFHEIGNKFVDRDGYMVRCTQMRDYHDTFAKERADIFDLTTRPEYSDESCKFFMSQNPSSAQIAEGLQTLHTFCGTPLHNWWAIDEKGGVYKCYGDFGFPENAIFDLMEPKETRKVNWEKLTVYMNFSPLKDPECRKCRVLPLCQGECAFEHILFGRYCRTFFYNIEDFVQAYYQAIKKEAREGKEMGATEQIKKPEEAGYDKLKIEHYELRLCLGSVEPGHESPKASV